jgi:hypothetical protein
MGFFPSEADGTDGSRLGVVPEPFVDHRAFEIGRTPPRGAGRKGRCIWACFHAMSDAVKEIAFCVFDDDELRTETLRKVLTMW